MANRVLVPRSAPGAAPAAAGPLSPPGAGATPGSGSSILQNRLRGTTEVAGAPEFNYPDIKADPAKLYHDRFGVEEDHDRFLLPWLMTLIFEDRWILAEPDPTKAFQNQLPGE